MRNIFISNRYITILFYLNDVEDGGETAFPVADDEAYLHDVSLIVNFSSFSSTLIDYFLDEFRRKYVPKANKYSNIAGF